MPKTQTIVPAQPGFEIRYLAKKNNWSVELLEPEPVIAWRIIAGTDEADCETWPVCIDSLCQQRFIIVHPDGRVTDPETAQFESVDDFLKDANKRG